MYRLFEQEIHIPDGYNGTMPNGDPLTPGNTTFSSMRSQYNKVEKYVEYKNAYESNNLASLGDSPEDVKKKQEAMESVELTLHRFWHAGDYLMALGTMADLYPDLQADKYDTDGGEVEEDLLKLNKSEVSIEVGETDTITSNVTGATFESADSSIATVSPSGVITGVKEGTTTITITTPKNQTATVTVTVTSSSQSTAGSLNPGEDYLWGDVDLNDAVETADLVLLSKHLVNTSIYKLGKGDEASAAKAATQANVQYDDNVNSLDSAKLVEFLLDAIDQDKLGPQ
jgi:hypothetical protein